MVDQIDDQNDVLARPQPKDGRDVARLLACQERTFGRGGVDEEAMHLVLF